MKRVFGVFGILVLGWWLMAAQALAASGYKAVVENDGVVTGMLVYYSDSVASYVPQLNAMINQMFSEMEGAHVYSQSPTTADDVLGTAMTVMSQGARSQGWDACFGFVIYRTMEANVNVIKTDIYVLGMEQDDQIVPYFYVGSFSLNEEAMGYLNLLR